MDYQNFSDHDLAILIIEKSKKLPIFPEEFQSLFEEVFEHGRDHRGLELYRAITIFNCNYDAYQFVSEDKKKFPLTFAMMQVKEYYEVGGDEEITKHLLFLKKTQPLIHSQLFNYEKDCRNKQVSQMLLGTFQKEEKVVVGTFIPDIYSPKNMISDGVEEDEAAFISFDHDKIIKK